MVLRTTNGGNSWFGSTIRDVNQLESIHFANEKVGYTSGEGKIYKSIDGGATWRDITPYSATSLWGCFFLTPDIGMVIGGGCVDNQQFYRTTNGGISWSLFTTAIPETGLTDLILYSENGLGYASSSGFIWRTMDGGRTWNIFSTSGSKDWQEEITHIGNSFLVPYAAGCSEGGPGGMRFSVDLGKSWRETYVGEAMFGAFLHDSLRGWACGWHGSVYYTSDGGKTWKLRNCGIDSRASLDDLWFINDTLGFVVGDGIYKSTKYDLLPPELLINGPTQFCEGDSIIISTPGQYENYRWSNGSTSPYIVVKKSGEYFLTVYNRCDTNTSKKIIVNVNPKPDLKIITNKPTKICEGDSVILSVNKAFVNYLWSNGSTQSSIVVRKSGKYSVEVVDTNGCSAKADTLVQVVPNPNPIVSILGRDKFCLGDSVFLATDTSYNIIDWYRNPGPKLVESGKTKIIVRDSGEYFVRVKNEWGCEGISNIVKISVILDSNRLTIENVNPENKLFFDSTKFLQLNCRTIRIKNISEHPYNISDILVFNNIAFSIPQHQFPIQLEPYQTRELTICYYPTELGKQWDTLLLGDNCSPHYVFLDGIGISNVYDGSSRCNVPIELQTEKLAGKYFMKVDAPFPNPSSYYLTIPFQRYYNKEEKQIIEDNIYNQLGQLLLAGNINVTKNLNIDGASAESGEITFPVFKLNSGTYFVNIKSYIFSWTFLITILK
jgi:photosystem II stability/assembly factor-like uncharacterized protein